MRERRPTDQEAQPSLPLIAEVFGQRDKVRNALTRLETGIEAILDSDNFKAYLAAMSRFHHYSYANNVALSAAQRPDATIVNSYNRWKQIDRHVKKDEHGMAIGRIDPTTIKQLKDKLLGIPFEIEARAADEEAASA